MKYGKLVSVYILMAFGFLAMGIPFVFPELAISSVGGMIGAFVGMIALIIAIFKTSESVGRFLFLAFATLTGSFIHAAVMKVAAVNMGAVLMAVGLTVLLFFLLSVYAVMTQRDFTSIGGYLMIALFVLIAAMVLNMFLAIPLLGLLISYAGVIIFGFCMIHDTQVIRNGDMTVPQGALALFLNVVNIFLHLLEILD